MVSSGVRVESAYVCKRGSPRRNGSKRAPCPDVHLLVCRRRPIDLPVYCGRSGLRAPCDWVTTFAGKGASSNSSTFSPVGISAAGSHGVTYSYDSVDDETGIRELIARL